MHFIILQSNGLGILTRKPPLGFVVSDIPSVMFSFTSVILGTVKNSAK